MTRSWRFPAALLCLCSVAIGPSALAQPAKKPDAKPQAQPQWKKAGGKLDPKMAEAKRLFDEGAKSYGEGNYEKAIESWQMSFEISKKDLICENIANAYERLGKPKEARDYLKRWRAAAPEDERETLDARIKNLDERISREEAADQQRKAEDDKREKERREREAAAAEVAGSSPISVPGIVLAGVGVGAVGAGVVLDVVANGKRPDETKVCRRAGDKQLCLASEKQSIETSNRLAFVGDVLWIGGAVAAAAGTVLIVTHHLSRSKAKRDSGSAFVAPVVNPQGGYIGVIGSF